MRRRLPTPKTTWTKRAVLLIQISVLLFWFGVAIQSSRLILASALIATYLVLSAVLTTSPSGLVTARRSIRNERVIEEHPFRMRTVVENRSSRNTLLYTTDHLPANIVWLEGGPSFAITLPPKSTTEVSEIITAMFRGHYLIPSPYMYTSDEFGLRERSVESASASFLSVLPPIEDISDFSLESRRSQPEIGTFRSGSVGVGTEFFGIREYLPGDELRRINWKASARTDDLLSNEYELEHVTNIYLFVDLSGFDLAGLRWSIKTAASIATYLLRTRNRLGLIVLGESVSHVPIEGGRRQLLRVLDKLITAEPGGTTEPSLYLLRLLEDLPPSEILLVSPLASSVIMKTVDMLKEKHGKMVVVTNTFADEKKADEKDPVTNVAHLLRTLKRRTAIKQIESSGVRVIEVPVDRSVRMVVSLIRERPLRR